MQVTHADVSFPPSVGNDSIHVAMALQILQAFPQQWQK